MKNLFAITLFLLSIMFLNSQNNISLDTTKWDIKAKAYVIENYKGKAAVYLQGGSMVLKDYKFTNGTIEYDIFLKAEQAFPGVYFRAQDNDSEQWFIRPHLSGKPDANQAAPLINGLTPWQLYFGEKYSFSYDYKFDDWTHVKLVVNDNRAQIYLDYSETPNLSWNLYLPKQEGGVVFTGGRTSGMHLANITIDKTSYKLSNFKALEREPIDGLVQTWRLSDKFEEVSLGDLSKIKALIENRKWIGNIEVEEGIAANIARKTMRYDGTKNNTVFAKIEINSDTDQTKLFQFGYSDRVVAILNGKPVYKGTNRWRTRDYRYLGTVGLFDAIYLNLKKGKNTLLMAVSEDFGGWLITGKFNDTKGITIKQ
jgi:hypothetical protein